MKTINMCSRPGGCCPKLAIHDGKKEVKFTLLDKGKQIEMTADEARKFALTIFEELGRK